MMNDELREFWKGWIDRFNDESTQYITPDDPTVVEFSNSIGVKPSDSGRQRAMKAWLAVFNHVDYQLSRKWYTPAETLNKADGDCEDMTFLLASIFPNIGVNPTVMAVGDITFFDGRTQQHTWNVVDGMIVDATGRPEVVDTIDYEEVKSWTIQTE